MNLTSLQIHEQLATHGVTKDGIENFCNGYKKEREVVIGKIAGYLLKQFGLFYRDKLLETITHPGLKASYHKGINFAFQSIRLLSQGKTEEARAQVLSNRSAYAAESAEEVLARDLEQRLSSFLMPTAQTRELVLRHPNIKVSFYFLKSLSKKEEDLAALVFNENLDLNKELKPDQLIEMEQFIFADGCMIRKDAVVNWITVIQSWIEEWEPPEKAQSRFLKLTPFQESIAQPKAAPPPAVSALDSFENDLVDISIDNNPPPIATVSIQERSFHQYVLVTTFENISRKLGIPIPDSVLERLMKYAKTNDTSRKFISYFVHLANLQDLELNEDGTPDTIFVISAQKMMYLRTRLEKPSADLDDVQLLSFNKKHVRFDHVLEWLFWAPTNRRRLINQKLPLRFGAPAVEMTTHLTESVAIARENRLSIFIYLCALEDFFKLKLFIDEIEKQQIFPLSEQFVLGYLESHRQPEDYTPALNACHQMARLLKAMQVDDLPGDFWVTVCSRFLTIDNLKSKVDQFLEAYQGKDVSNKEDFQHFVIAYFTGTISQTMLQIIPRFKEQTDRELSFTNIVSIFSHPLSPLKEDFESSIPFCGEQLQALERYRLSNVEMGLLFYDFLSVTDNHSISKNILYLSLIEEFTCTPLPKNIMRAWMHYRPLTVPVEEIKIPVGKLIADLWDSRQEIGHKYLNRAVIPYSSIHLLHDLIARFPHAEPNEANQHALDNFAYASQFVVTQLSFSSSPLNAQLFSEAVCRTALESGEFRLEESRALQRMNSICPLTKGHEKAIYRGWSKPQNEDDWLKFELYLIDLRTLRTYGSQHTLLIPSGVLKTYPKIWDIVHQAAIILGEERAEPLRVNEGVPEFANLLNKYPKLRNLWNQFKKSSVCEENAAEAFFEFIEWVRTEDAGVHPDVLEFELYLLFYPKFAEQWTAFNCEGIKKEELAAAILKFVFPLKVAFRKGMLGLAKALPESVGEDVSLDTQQLAHQGNVYPLESGMLSLLPPRGVYRTPAMMKRYAVTQNCNPIVQIVQAGKPVKNSEISYSGRVLSVSFDPLPQGDEQIPLNQLTISFGSASQVVRYTELVNAPNFETMVRWHVLILLSKVNSDGN